MKNIDILTDYFIDYTSKLIKKESKDLFDISIVCSDGEFMWSKFLLILTGEFFHNALNCEDISHVFLPQFRLRDVKQTLTQLFSCKIEYDDFIEKNEFSIFLMNMKQLNYTFSGVMYRPTVGPSFPVIKEELSDDNLKTEKTDNLTLPLIKTEDSKKNEEQIPEEKNQFEIEQMSINLVSEIKNSPKRTRFNEQPMRIYMGKSILLKTRKVNPESSSKSPKSSPFTKPSNKKNLLRDEDGFWKCNTCTMKFPTKRTLKEHRRENHKKQFCWKCNLCTMTFPLKKQLKEHRRENHRKPEMVNSARDGDGFWNCNLCFKKFSSRRKLLIHKGEEHEKSRKREMVNSARDGDGFWNCKLCFKKFSSRRKLQIHKGDEHEKPKTIKKTPVKDGEKDEDGFWKCNHCTMKFSFKKQLADHVDENHKTECPDQYICTVCGRGFRKVVSYRYHMDTHEENNFQCPDCSKVYPTKLCLYTHIKFQHKKVELLPCETCGKGFKTKTFLIKHINVVHKKIKRFKCLNCHSCFGSKGVFQTHCKYKHQVEDREAANKMLKVLSEKEALGA